MDKLIKAAGDLVKSYEGSLQIVVGNVLICEGYYPPPLTDKERAWPSKAFEISSKPTETE